MPTHVNALPTHQRDLSGRALGPFARILVAVDASPASEGATRLAISLAGRDRGVDLVFCHVIDVHRMLVQAERCFDDFHLTLPAVRDGARELLDRCCALAGHAGVRARSYVRDGKPSEEIAWLADALDVDLIVIGNRPKHKLQRLLYGSVRDRLVRTSTRPVLAADTDPSLGSEFHPGCILASVEDSPASVRAVRLAAEIAAAYASRLVVLASGSGGGSLDAVLGEALKALRMRRVEVAKAVPGVAWDRAMDLAVSAYQPGMIVMGAARRPGLRGLATPEAVERVLQHVPVPLLVVQDEPSRPRSRSAA